MKWCLLRKPDRRIRYNWIFIYIFFFYLDSKQKYQIKSKKQIFQIKISDDKKVVCTQNVHTFTNIVHCSTLIHKWKTSFFSLFVLFKKSNEIHAKESLNVKTILKNIKNNVLPALMWRMWLHYQMETFFDASW